MNCSTLCDHRQQLDPWCNQQKYLAPISYTRSSSQRSRSP